jgi:hypothetical protein
MLDMPKLNALLLLFPLAAPPAAGGNALSGAEVYARVAPCATPKAWRGAEARSGQ